MSKAISSQIRHVVSSIRRAASKYRAGMWQIEGKERTSGVELSVLYIGTPANKNYISHAAFGGSAREQHIGNNWAISAMRKAERLCDECSMVFIESRDKPVGSDKYSIVYSIPCWFDGLVDFSVAETQIKRSKNVRRDLQKVTKNNLQYKISTRKEDFDYFYHNMYVPYIKSAHGERALLMSYENMDNRRCNSELLLVHKDGEVLSGSILLYENGEVQGWKHGVKDGNKEYVKMGAVAALYYYEIDYLAKSGRKYINHGGTRPFLNDGVLQYKKKWGMILGRPWATRYVLMAKKRTAGLDAFLKNNPFIYEEGDCLNGAVFLPEHSDLSNGYVENLRKSFYIPGMGKLNVYLLGEETRSITLSDELSDVPEIRTVA